MMVTSSSSHLAVRALVSTVPPPPPRIVPPTERISLHRSHHLSFLFFRSVVSLEAALHYLFIIQVLIRMMDLFSSSSFLKPLFISSFSPTIPWAHVVIYCAGVTELSHHDVITIVIHDSSSHHDIITMVLPHLPRSLSGADLFDGLRPLIECR